MVAPTPVGRSRRGLIGQHFVPDHAARVLRSVALVWAPVAVLGIAAWTWRSGVPASGEAGFWEGLALCGVLVAYLTGWLLALRWIVPGSTLLAVGAVGVGILASLEHKPLVSFLPTLVLFVPAFLLWLVWQRTHRLGAITALAALLAALLVGGGWAAAGVWDHFYGPSHPQSDLRAGPDTPVRWIWTGGVSATSATVVARVRDDDPATPIEVAVAPGGSSAATIMVPAERTPTDPSVVRAELGGLEPGTEYRVAVAVAGAVDEAEAATFTTFPEGAASFTFAFGSCSRLGSNGAVYDAIRAADPLFFLATGDWYYADIATDDPAAFRDAYDQTLTAPAQAALYREVPVAYVWDDHDYGPNDADGTSASRPAAQAVYRERVPHYVLAGDDSPIFQAFTVGRVRVILTDGRSARDPDAAPDGPGKSMLGDEQRAWLEAELVEASRTHALVILVTNVPWITPAEAGADHWGGFATERAWLADVIAGHGIANLVMLAGDAHMVAIDDGSHTGFATGSAAGEPAFPLMHAAALDRAGSLKGGPYSEGAFPGAGRFGLVTVDDDGTEVRVTLDGRTWDGTSLVTYRFTVPPAVEPAG
ncbi:MAG: alkaline phosphatase family protein [Acidimicrobiales bacterium]|nr:alkaline phosphatase family protein [Acidimicrobiales bacterium]